LANIGGLDGQKLAIDVTIAQTNCKLCNIKMQTCKHAKLDLPACLYFFGSLFFRQLTIVFLFFRLFPDDRFFFLFSFFFFFFATGCAVVTDRDYPHGTAMELLQETYQQFLQIQRDNNITQQQQQQQLKPHANALSYPCRAAFATLLEKYQDPAKVLASKPNNASQLLRESRNYRSKSLLLLSGNAAARGGGGGSLQSADDEFSSENDSDDNNYVLLLAQQNNNVDAGTTGTGTATTNTTTTTPALAKWQQREREQQLARQQEKQNNNNAKSTANNNPPWKQQQQQQQLPTLPVQRQKSQQQQQDVEMEMIDTVVQHESSEDDDDSDLEAAAAAMRRNGGQRQQPYQTTNSSSSLLLQRQDESSKTGVEVVVNVSWDTRPEWMTHQQKPSLRSVRKDEPTITTRTNTTVSGMTTIQGDYVVGNGHNNHNHNNNNTTPTTPRSILLQENKNSSIQSTLGGSVNDEDDEHLQGQDISSSSPSAAKHIPVWIKARENLRSTPQMERPKKHASAPVATRDDLRPTPSTMEKSEKGTTTNNDVPFSPEALRSTPQKTQQPKRSHVDPSGTLTSSPSPPPPPPPPPSTSSNEHLKKDKTSSVVQDSPSTSPEPFWKKLASIKRAPTTSSIKSSPDTPNKTTKVISTHVQQQPEEKQPSSAAHSGATHKSPGRKIDTADAPIVPLTRIVSNGQQKKKDTATKAPTISPQRPLAAEETARKPTISRYDNWELVKANYLPSLDPESVDPSTLTHGDAGGGSLDDNDAVSAKSSSAASDWGVPTRNQNADDSSWVNPARPIDPERREQIKSEVDQTFLLRLEQARTTQPLASNLPVERTLPVVKETMDDRPDPPNKDANMKAALLAAAMATQPGSYDEEQGWVPVSKSLTPSEVSKRVEIKTRDDSETWNMPSQATATKSIFRKAEEEEKDYRYTYITARPVSSQPNHAAPPVTSYWDKVRQNYFDGRQVPVPTEGPATSSSYDLNAKPSWRDGGDQSVESGSWLPPGGIDPSARNATRSIPIGGDDPPARTTRTAAVRQAAANDHTHQRDFVSTYSSYSVDPDSGDKSVVTSDSDWQPPGANTRMGRVDFTGRVTANYDKKKHHQRYDDSDSSSSTSENFAWVPKLEDIAAGNVDERPREQRAASSTATGLPSFPSQSSNHSQYKASSSSIDESGWETGSEYSMEDVASSVWTSDLKLESDDDYKMDQNISGHSIDFVKEEEDASAAVTVSAVKFELAQVELQQYQKQRQSKRRGQALSPPPPPPPVRGVVARSHSNDSSSASLDSVLSYTGRISFKMSPEVIHFQDDPDEDRGRHYSQYGRANLSGGSNSSSRTTTNNNNKHSGYTSYKDRPDPCIYYTLCCAMIAVPAAILIVMFVFVIDLDGSDSNDDSN
jgi:hypothetical protein